MTDALAGVIENCLAAVEQQDPQASVQAILLEAAADAAVVDAIAGRTKFRNLQDLALYRSEALTLLAGALPPGFSAGPHNHNLWSVVSVCSGQEDNEFFERSEAGLKSIGRTSVVAPGVLPNAADVIHAICNPLDVPLLVLHAYGGDLFAVERSNWDSETQQEVPFDWRNVASK